MTPLLSVILPTYNGSDHVVNTLTSITNNDPYDVEVIAIDDGSTDDTVSILRRFEHELNLSIIQCKRVGNWVAASNLGASTASGKYLCLLHQDDTWNPQRLDYLRPLLLERKHELVIHSTQFMNDAGEKLGVWKCPLESDSVSSSDNFLERCLVQNFVAIPAPVFSRRLFNEINGMNESLWYTADWDLWLSLGAKTDPYYVDVPLTSYRIHKKSQTSMRTHDLVEYRNQLECVLARHLETWDANQRRKKRTQQIAGLSIDINELLAGVFHRRWSDLPLSTIFRIAASPTLLPRYLRDSRIVERLLPRIRSLLIPTI